MFYFCIVNIDFINHLYNRKENITKIFGNIYRFKPKYTKRVIYYYAIHK